MRTSGEGMRLGGPLCVFRPIVNCRSGQLYEVFRPRHLYYLHTRSIGVIA
jgi:hypothetical protein